MWTLFSEDAKWLYWNVLLHGAVNNEFHINRLVALISRVVHLLWQCLAGHRLYLTFIMLTLPVIGLNMVLVLAAVDVASSHEDSWLSQTSPNLWHIARFGSRL